MESDPLISNSSPSPFTTNIFRTYVQPCITEFVATAIFVFAGTTSVHTGNVLLIALVHGLTVTLLVFCFGDISGAHFNPAVTVGVLIAGGIQAVLAVFYFISQIAGGITGAALMRAVLSFTPPNGTASVYETIEGGTHHLAPGMNIGQGILLEVFMTFMLVNSVLTVAVDRRNPMCAFAIGFTAFADIAMSADLTGGSMNPARSFGPAVVYTKLWLYHYIYWIGPLIGAIIAGFTYRFVFATGKKRVVCCQACVDYETVNNDDI